jgi:L-seryl-tRNA(Ser) seleniumtransferase
MDDKQKTLLKSLPKIDEVLVLLEKRGTLERAPRGKVLETIREVVAGIRSAILAGSWDAAAVLSNESAADAAAARIERLHEYSLRRVINATGIILHTNLGRAPLCKEAQERIIEVSRGYSNVEFDLASGKRGLRYDHIRSILCELTGAEDALVVNNNAAAVLLVLSTLARGREAIVSRGELIEIGGEFRIPEVMERSGAILREVGATNRTHLSDYEKALNENTALIMKVHTSNFRIVGFTEEVPVPELLHWAAVTGFP